MENIFEVKDVEFAYNSKSPNIVKGATFNIKKGEIFGFLGLSGAGKTTTQKILIKTLSKYKGQVKFNGQDLKELGNDFFEKIGVSFEFPVYFNKLTGYKNILFYAALYKQTDDIDKLFKEMGLWEHKDKKVSEYSKGMKMRLNFIRALISDPEVLFLDEPTNGLDPKTALVMKEKILELKAKGKTIFLTTHLMNDVEYLCDRVAFIVDGKIKLIDTVSNLKKNNNSTNVVVTYLNKDKEETKEFKLKDTKTAAFAKLLKDKDVVSIETNTTSLDDIFIKVTGEQTGNNVKLIKEVAKKIKGTK